MNNDLHPTAQKFVGAAQTLGLDIKVTQFAISTRTAAEAADALGCEVAQIVKSLVFVVNGVPTMALVSGNNRLDVGKLATACGVGKSKVKRADADVVRQATGFAIGGVPPFAHATSMPIYLDETLWQFAEIWAAAGTPKTVFPLTPEALLQATGGTVIDLRVTD